MARIPDWFQRLDPILEVLRNSGPKKSNSQNFNVDWLGRNEVKALFGISERDSIRLLHKFGATEQHNALSLPRSALLAQLEAIRSGSAYAAFLSQRHKVAQALNTAREQAAARKFPIQPLERHPRLEDLPETITWRRAAGSASGRFEILYRDGADLMNQISQFLTAAGASRQEFLAGTEPSE